MIAFLFLLAGVILLALAGAGVPTGRVRLEWWGWACVITALAVLPAARAL